MQRREIKRIRPLTAVGPSVPSIMTSAMSGQIFQLAMALNPYKSQQTHYPRWQQKPNQYAQVLDRQFQRFCKQYKAMLTLHFINVWSIKGLLLLHLMELVWNHRKCPWKPSYFQTRCVVIYYLQKSILFAYRQWYWPTFGTDNWLLYSHICSWCVGKYLNWNKA